MPLTRSYETETTRDDTPEGKRVREAPAFARTIISKLLRTNLLLGYVNVKYKKVSKILRPILSFSLFFWALFIPQQVVQASLLSSLSSTSFSTIF